MRRVLLLAALLTGQIAGEPLRFAVRHIEKKIPGCDDPHRGCASVEFTYVQAISGPAAIRDRINAGIRNSLAHEFCYGADSPEECADNYLAGYGEATKIGVTRPCHLSAEIKILHKTSRIVSLQSSEDYEGGAHPNDDTDYLNFDARTGDILNLTSILKDRALGRITDLAEKYFRKVRELSPAVNLTEVGFNFPEGFELPASFGLTQNALLFDFNTHEIAPRTMGSTLIEIPLVEIRALIRPEFLQ